MKLSTYSENQEKRCIAQWNCCAFGRKYPIIPAEDWDRCDATLKDSESVGLEFKDKTDAKGNFCFFSTYENENKNIYINYDKINYLNETYVTAFICVFFRDKVAVANVRDVMKCNTSVGLQYNPDKGKMLYEKHYDIPASVFKTVNNEWFNRVK